jgi:hypothetical protein
LRYTSAELLCERESRGRTRQPRPRCPPMLLGLREPPSDQWADSISVLPPVGSRPRATPLSEAWIRCPGGFHATGPLRLSRREGQEGSVPICEGYTGRDGLSCRGEPVSLRSALSRRAGAPGSPSLSPWAPGRIGEEAQGEWNDRFIRAESLATSAGADRGSGKRD